MTYSLEVWFLVRVSGIPSERALARASEHLAAGRYAEATGAFRAVLSIQDSEFRAHLGLADAGVARGANRDQIVDDLVAAAGDFADREQYDAAFAVLSKALSVDPARLEVHIDVAELEARSGHPELAAGRLENLARAYNAAGQTDEAEAVLAVAAGFREEEPASAVLAAASVTERAPTISATAPGPSTRARTMPAPEAPASITVSSTTSIAAAMPAAFSAPISAAISAAKPRPALVGQRPITTNKARVRGPNWRPGVPTPPTASTRALEAADKPASRDASAKKPARKPAKPAPRSQPVRVTAAPRPAPLPAPSNASQPSTGKNHATAVRATAQRGAKLIVGKLARPTAVESSGLADRLRRQSNRGALRRSTPTAIRASTPALRDTFDEQPTSLFAAP